MPGWAIDSGTVCEVKVSKLRKINSRSFIPGTFLKRKLLLLQAISFPSQHLTLFLLRLTRAHVTANPPIKKSIRKQKSSQ